MSPLLSTTTEAPSDSEKLQTLLSRMTNWQNTKWMREYAEHMKLKGLLSLDKKLELAEKWANTSRRPA